ncbi:hypothetical protein MASR1M107_33110 [Ignavibacteriales bacterium]
MFKKLLFAFSFLFLSVNLFASEADLKIPSLNDNQTILLYYGLVVCIAGLAFGIYQYLKVKKLQAHKSMLDIAQVIFETSKTYLVQQGKFLAILFAFIAVCVAFYFGFLQGNGVGNVLFILGWTVIGILGSYAVAWFWYSNEYNLQVRECGIRIFGRGKPISNCLTSPLIQE